MAYTGSGQGSSLRLRVASWGDPDLNLPGNGGSALNYSNAEPHRNGVLTADNQDQLPPDIHTPHAAEGTPEASGSYHYRDGVEVDNPDDVAGTRRKLRPRSGLHNLVAASALDQLEDDEDMEYNSQDDSEEEGTRKGKKKVGRPIAYRGDPNSPHLTEAERRRMRRRIANRESARRVRNKRQEFLEDLQGKIHTVQAQNQELMACTSEIERHKATLMQQMYGLREKWTSATQENSKLRGEVASLRHNLQEQQAELNRLDKPPASIAAGNNNRAVGPTNHAWRPIATTAFPSGTNPPTTGNAFDLPSLLQLSSVPSRELFMPGGDSRMQRQSSVQPPPGVAKLPDISPLTGLRQLTPTPKSAAASAAPTATSTRSSGKEEMDESRIGSRANSALALDNATPAAKPSFKAVTDGAGKGLASGFKRADSQTAAFLKGSSDSKP